MIANLDNNIFICCALYVGISVLLILLKTQQGHQILVDIVFYYKIQTSLYKVATSSPLHPAHHFYL